MNEIRTTKIDGQEFVPFKDYQKLKEELKDLVEENIELNKKYMIVLTENNNLNKQIEQFKKGVKAGTNIIERLEEENKKLKSDLEQFSEAYKRYRDYEKEELAESCYDLERENKKLKEKLEKIKETYIRFEDSEKEYNKGLGELDQLIMNR